jgi:hypothetical protein
MNAADTEAFMVLSLNHILAEVKLIVNVFCPLYPPNESAALVLRERYQVRCKIDKLVKRLGGELIWNKSGHYIKGLRLPLLPEVVTLFVPGRLETMKIKVEETSTNLLVWVKMKERNFLDNVLGRLLATGNTKAVEAFKAEVSKLVRSLQGPSQRKRKSQRKKPKKVKAHICEGAVPVSGQVYTAEEELEGARVASPTGPSDQ